MNLKRELWCIGLGMGSVLLYQNIKNGNVRKITRKMNSSKTKMLEDMENYLKDM